MVFFCSRCNRNALGCGVRKGQEARGNSAHTGVAVVDGASDESLSFLLALVNLLGDKRARVFACVSLCAIGDAVSLYPTTLALAPPRCLLAARPPTAMGRGERAPEPEEDESMTASAEEKRRLRSSAAAVALGLPAPFPLECFNVQRLLHLSGDELDHELVAGRR